jgi:hypothetical protein
MDLIKVYSPSADVARHTSYPLRPDTALHVSFMPVAFLRTAFALDTDAKTGIAEARLLKSLYTRVLPTFTYARTL